MPFVRLLKAVPVLAALVSLGACAPPGTAAGSGTPAVSASARGTSAGAAVAGPDASQAPADAALLDRLLPYPADARRWGADRTGVLGLGRFIDNFYVKSSWDNERGLMTQRRFVRAARHGWINADGSQDDVWLVDFATAAGARSMYLGLTGNWKDAARPAAEFADPAVHGEGQTTTTLDSLGNAYAKVAAVSGHTVVYVKVYTAASPERAAAVALMARQYARMG